MVEFFSFCTHAQKVKNSLKTSFLFLRKKTQVNLDRHQNYSWNIFPPKKMMADIRHRCFAFSREMKFPWKDLWWKFEIDKMLQGNFDGRWRKFAMNTRQIAEMQNFQWQKCQIWYTSPTIFLFKCRSSNDKAMDYLVKMKVKSIRLLFMNSLAL